MVSTLQSGKNNVNANKSCGVKYWEIIAENLSKAGWSWGCVSAVDCEGRTIWIVAVTSFVFVLIRWYRQLWITSLSSAAVVAFTFFNFQSKMSQATRQMETELADNPFRGLADLAVQSVQLQWGWAVLVIGIAFLIVVAAMKDTVDDWSH